MISSPRRLQAQLESEDFSCEHLHVARVSGRERISQLFRFEILVVSTDPAGLDVEKIAGGCAGATLVFVDETGERRRIHGILVEATDLLDSEADYLSYRLVLVPRLFQMTLIRTQDVFVDVTVPDILLKKAALIALTPGEQDIEMRFLRPGDYPTREFVIQYAETDLAFVSRLAEHLGVSFLFEQQGGRDRTVFTDHTSGFPRLEDAVPFRPRGERRDVYRLELTSRVIPAFYAVQDYDYEKPLVELLATHESARGYSGGVVEFGTNFKDTGTGGRLARIRAEEQEAHSLQFTGESGVCAFTAGARFTLAGHPRLGDRELLLVEVEHLLIQAPLGAGDTGEPASYHNVFHAIPAEATYRPARVTPRPRLAGIMNGIVEALPGAPTVQPWIDTMGRYFVRVLFDTAPPGERKASLPIRMAQSQSGPDHGFHFPLRPGTEVLLAFVEGDPDRPVIVGSVPNAVTPSPVVQGDNVRNRIKTSSGVIIEINDGI
jgi:type VI secretion system secreted protein VgrG